MYAYRTPGVYFEWLDQPVPRLGLPRTDVAGFLGFAERGPLHKPVRITGFEQFRAVFGGHMAESYLAYAVEGFFQNSARACWVIRVDSPEHSRTASLVVGDRSSSERLLLSATSPGRWGNRLRVRIVGNSWERFTLFVSAPDGTEQIVRDPAGDLKLRLHRVNLATAEDLIDPEVSDTEVADIDFELLVRVDPAPPDSPIDIVVGDPSKSEARLAGGADGIESVTPEHFIGDDSTHENPRGLKAFEMIDDVAILAIPDIMPKLPVPEPVRPTPRCTVLTDEPDRGYEPPPALQPPAFGDDEIHALQVAMLTHCLRLRDRFAILDVRRQDLQPTQAEEWRNEFTYEESFAALYYPWIRVNDPLELEGLVRTIPPSGHIAGVFARTDLTQGVHQAPGNEVVEGVRDVVFAVNSREHGDLNSVGVNVILPWPGGGIRVFGARTLYQAPLLRYINVRRLLLWIEEAIDESTQWIVFEPNNDALRRDTDRAVRGLLESLFRRGMLDGAKIDDAFSVQCDERNNPPEEVDAGRLICEVGVQPPRPAEFVVVRIGRTQSGIEVLEERSVARG